jgi:glucose/mannose-6-phosphate isomerase
MLQKVSDFPSQVLLAYASLNGHKMPSQFSEEKIANIVIMGMGASGVVGDFVKVLLRNQSIPIYVQKSSKLPRFVNGDSLVVSITYSGKTRETLDALNSSISAGAKNLVMTSSYELGAICAKKNIPWISVPENGFPRATLGYMLVAILGALHKLGIGHSIDSDIAEVLAVLREVKKQCGPGVPQGSNPARLLALALLGRFPVVYGESEFTDVVALRWKQQINENASWHHPDNAQVKDYALLLLRDSVREHEEGIDAKVEAAKRLAEVKGAKVYDLWTKGKSELARLLSLCYLGDFVSVYLAISRGIDPGPVHNIEQLKKVAHTDIKGQ